jgi:hypothetical protein
MHLGVVVLDLLTQQLRNFVCLDLGHALYRLSCLSRL